mmetsp:Transcript_28677/g.68217  ORF Transcript_28677/g.68217 Transcript_28677/m.68217 type:complete len:227 (+) Transcript_28677:227-907(+)
MQPHAGARVQHAVLRPKAQHLLVLCLHHVAAAGHVKAHDLHWLPVEFRPVGETMHLHHAELQQVLGSHLQNEAVLQLHLVASIAKARHLPALAVVLFGFDQAMHHDHLPHRDDAGKPLVALRFSFFLVLVLLQAAHTVEVAVHGAHGVFEALRLVATRGVATAHADRVAHRGGAHGHAHALADQILQVLAVGFPCDAVNSCKGGVGRAHAQPIVRVRASFILCVIL